MGPLLFSLFIKDLPYSTYHQDPQPDDIASTLLEEEEGKKKRGKELVCTLSKKFLSGIALIRVW